MRKYLFLAVAALSAVAVTSSVALAAVNVKSLPVATFGDPDPASVTLRGGNFSGLGNVPAFANLTVNGVATYTCTNPNGNPSPGQNPVPAQPGSSGPVGLGNSDHNGRGTITTITAHVTAPSPAPNAVTVGCGGGGAAAQGKWTVTLDSLTATSAQLVITQAGNTILCRNYTQDGTGVPC